MPVLRGARERRHVPYFDTLYEGGAVTFTVKTWIDVQAALETWAQTGERIRLIAVATDLSEPPIDTDWRLIKGAEIVLTFDGRVWQELSRVEGDPLAVLVVKAEEE